MKKYTVIKDWATVYTDPLILKKDQKITIDNRKIEENPGWHGWVWCFTDDNKGWVPVQLLKVYETSGDHSKAVLTEDYSARELDAVKGNVVTGDKILNGWLWGKKENSEDQGWIPIENLKQE